MDGGLDRRRFLMGLAALPAIPVLSPRATPLRRSVRAEAPSHFPHQDPALVSAVVGASHRDLDRVRELVDARPALARASWDWGFGDWETALGAASHVGRPDIAEYLIAQGARPNLFTWTMLGQLDVVRAAIQASPGVEAIPGPHGITLLAHARAGGDDAGPVLAYLEELGTADPRPETVALPEQERAALVGVYAFGAVAADRLEVVETRGMLQIRVPEGVARNLFHLGDWTFHPAGVPHVRVVFERAAASAVGLTLTDADLRLEARRVA